MTFFAAFALNLLQDVDAKAELGKAVKKTADWSSYAYTDSREMEGSWGPSRGPMKSEGVFQKDVGLTTKSDESEALKVGDAVVYKDRDGAWKKVPKEEPRPEGGGEGREGREGRRNGDWRSMRYRNMSAPHENLAGLEEKFKAVKMSEATEKVGEAECVVFSGDLTEEAVKEMSQRGRRGGPGGRGGELTDAKYEGSAKVWIDDEYRVLKVVIETTSSGVMEGRDGMPSEFEMTSIRTVEFSKVGEAKVEVSDDAKKALEAKEETKP